MGIKNIIVKGFSLLKPIPLKDKIINYESLEVAVKGIFAEIKKKEPKITRTNTPENDSNKVFSAKGALGLLNKLTTQISLAIEECKKVLRVDISKKQNKDDSNLITEDKTIVGGINENTNKLKDLNITKEDKIIRTDSPENNSNKVFSSLGALNLKNWLVTNYTTLMNNIRDNLITLINGKLSHGGYRGNAQTLFNLINSKINKSDISSSISSTSTSTVANSHAVKLAYDKGVEAYNKANLAGMKSEVIWSGSSHWNTTLNTNKNWSQYKLVVIESGGNIGGVLFETYQAIPIPSGTKYTTMGDSIGSTIHRINCSTGQVVYTGHFTGSAHDDNRFRLIVGFK